MFIVFLQIETNFLKKLQCKEMCLSIKHFPLFCSLHYDSELLSHFVSKRILIHKNSLTY